MGLRWAEGIESEELPGGETVVVRADTGSAVVLNEMGGVVWDLCADGRRDAAEIAAFINESLPDADRAKVVADVQALIAELIGKGLLEEQGTCSRPPSAP
jgi:hypothetical protein